MELKAFVSVLLDWDFVLKLMYRPWLIKLSD